MDRLFALTCENNLHQISYNWYFLPIVEIKDYNVSIDGQNFFDLPVKKYWRTWDSIRENATCQEDDTKL